MEAVLQGPCRARRPRSTSCASSAGAAVVVEFGRGCCALRYPIRQVGLTAPIAQDRSRLDCRYGDEQRATRALAAARVLAAAGRARTIPIWAMGSRPRGILAARLCEDPRGTGLTAHRIGCCAIGVPEGRHA